MNINNQQISKHFSLSEIVKDALFVLAFSSFIAYLRPFGMDEVSLAYAWFFWVVVCFCGYAIYSPVIVLGEKYLSRVLPKKADKYWLKLAISTLIASTIMSFIVPLIILVFFDLSTSYFEAIPRHFIPCILIGGFITLAGVVNSFLHDQKLIIHEQRQVLAAQSKQLTTKQTQSGQEFIEKLPIEKRGALICLQMDDHYLNVYTDKGKHMMLMRFKDALALLNHYPGLQTHRSWWVANEAIIGSKKDGRKLILKLQGGIEAPVSNTYLANVKTVL